MKRYSAPSLVVAKMTKGTPAPLDRYSHSPLSARIRPCRCLRIALGLASGLVVFATAAILPAQQTATQVISTNEDIGYLTPTASSNLLNAATLVASPTTPNTQGGVGATSTTFATLTDGSFGTVGTGTAGYADTTSVLVNNNSLTLTYTFTTPETIATIDTYSAWLDSGRDGQKYSIYYTTTTNSTLTQLSGSSVSTGGSNNSEFVQLAIPGGLANVTSIQFAFANSQENGYVGMKQLAVLGIASSSNALVWSGVGTTWDNSNTNWTNSTTGATGQTYSDPNAVVFGNSGIANPNITVQSVSNGGVNPTSVMFANTSGTYAFTNGTATSGIGGAASVSLNGTGTVSFNSPNTYTGATTLTAGTLILNDPNAIQNSTLNLSGGSLVFQSPGTAFTVGGLAGPGNLSLQNNAATPAAVALTVSGSNVNTTYSGSLRGLGSLNLNDSGGTLRLSGISTYAGSTTVTSGTLRLANTVAVSDPVFANANDPLITTNNTIYRAISASPSGPGYGNNVPWTPIGSSWSFQNNSGIATGNGSWGLPTTYPFVNTPSSNTFYQVAALQDHTGTGGATAPPVRGRP